MTTLMKINSLFKISALLFAPVLVLGCSATVGEEQGNTESGEPSADTSQALTNGWWSSGVTGGLKDTGLPSSSWTCFLSGVKGLLQSEVGVNVQQLQGHMAYAGAEVGANGHWYIKATNGFTAGGDVAANVMCVPTAANRTTVAHWASWSNNGQATYLAPTTDPSLVCGLVAVGNGIHLNDASGSNDNLWKVNGNSGIGSGDSAYVFKANNQWFLGGSGNAEAWAVCVDQTPGGGRWGWVFNGWGTWNLFQSNINDTQCFLNGVGGNFRVSDTSRGVVINYASSNLQWSVTTTSGQGSGVTCIE